MLILTRRSGEALTIKVPSGTDGFTVTVRILGRRGNQIHVGVDAPKYVTIHRDEIWKRIQREKTTAEPPQLVE